MTNDFDQMTRELEYQATTARKISECGLYIPEVRAAAMRRLVLLREAISIVPMVPELVDTEGQPY